MKHLPIVELDSVKLLYVGALGLGFTDPDLYYTKDYSKFYNEKGKEWEPEDLEQHAIWLDDPWSQDHESWTIKVNCSDAYTKMDPNDPKFYCEYSCMCTEGIEASFRGYGDTQQEALDKCETLMKAFKDKYLPKKEEK